MGVIHFVPVGDTKLALHDFGGSGPALLILHCNGFPARAYLPLVRQCHGTHRLPALLMRTLLPFTIPRRASVTLRVQDAGDITRKGSPDVLRRNLNVGSAACCLLPLLRARLPGP